ncbi:MAG: hypothetical protein ACKOGB_11875 [Betaproteobacteria bacterium]
MPNRHLHLVFSLSLVTAAALAQGREPKPTPEPVGSWPEANRVVEEVGGWRSYLKEAHGLPGSSPASSPPSSQAPGAPANTSSTATDRQVLPPASARWHRSEQDVAQARARVQQLLLQPLSAAAAVEVALLNNAGLQAQLAELGITQAEVMQASRLPNPGFSYGRSSEGDKREIERGLLRAVPARGGWGQGLPIGGG